MPTIIMGVHAGENFCHLLTHPTSPFPPQGGPFPRDISSHLKEFFWAKVPSRTASTVL